MLMTRVKYQQTLKLLPHSVGNKRVYSIQKFVDGVLKDLEVLKNEKTNHGEIPKSYSQTTTIQDLILFLRFIYVK